jgi:hypothetical protein
MARWLRRMGLVEPVSKKLYELLDGSNRVLYSWFMMPASTITRPVAATSVTRPAARTCVVGGRRPFGGAGRKTSGKADKQDPVPV